VQNLNSGACRHVEALQAENALNNFN